MNFEGCKRKFDTYTYIDKVKNEISSEINPFKKKSSILEFIKKGNEEKE